MYPIADIVCDTNKKYDSNHWVTRIRDSFKTNIIRKYYVKDLNLKISTISLPPNYNSEVYRNNLLSAVKKVGKQNIYISPRTFRLYDFKIYNKFQKRLFGYGVIRSIQLLLRVNNKDIRNSCIVVYDAAEDINYPIICEVARKAKYLVLLSTNILKITKLSEYIVANYGITPVVTTDIDFAVKDADFIISSKNFIPARNVFMWYLDNSFFPNGKVINAVNNVDYRTSWGEELEIVSSELLGAIMSQLSNDEIEKALNANGVYLENIKFNEVVINCN